MSDLAKFAITTTIIILMICIVVLFVFTPPKKHTYFVSYSWIGNNQYGTGNIFSERTEGFKTEKDINDITNWITENGKNIDNVVITNIIKLPI